MPAVLAVVERARCQLGRLIAGKFKLLELIGIGGAGAVFKAEQVALGRTVAVKLLHTDHARNPAMVDRFRTEAMAASRIQHLHCAAIFDYGDSDGVLYLAMEYVRGPTLSELIDKQPDLSTVRAVHLMLQLLAGIEEAHLNGVIHADLKPDNVLLDQRRSGSDVIKIVDFGIARFAQRPTTDTRIAGTPEYMAPEVIAGALPAAASDVYALGVICYELLSGHVPFRGTTREILDGHTSRSVPPLIARTTISGELAAVVERALAKDPKQRFRTASEMRGALASVPDAHEAMIRCLYCAAECAASSRFCATCGRRLRIARTQSVVPVDRQRPLIGRVDEVARLCAHREGALIIEGGIGAGKTALLDRVHAAHLLERRCYRMAADPSGLARPLVPIRNLVHSVVVGSERGLAETTAQLQPLVAQWALAARHATALASLFDLPTVLDELAPARRAEAVGAGVIALLERAALRGDFTLLCDDVDRYDPPTLAIVDRLSERPPARSAVILAVAPELAASWAPAVPRMALAPLTVADVAQLIADCPHTGPLDATALHHITGGIVGHLEHVVRLVGERGSIEHLPLTQRDAVGARIDLLDPATRSALQQAAVEGIDPHTTHGVVDQAVERGLIGPTGFASWLVRDTLYDSMPADARRAHHLRRARSLGASPCVIELAHHYDRGGDRERAADMLAQAGERIATLGDPAGACRRFERALALLRVLAREDDQQRDRQLVSVSVHLADQLIVCGETTLARGVLEEARPWATTPGLRGAVERTSARLAAVEQAHDIAIVRLRTAIGQLIEAGDLDALCQAYLELSEVLLRIGQRVAARDELVQCVDVTTLGEGIGATVGPRPLWRVLRTLAALDEGEPAQSARLREATLAHASRTSRKPW